MPIIESTLWLGKCFTEPGPWVPVTGSEPGAPPTPRGTGAGERRIYESVGVGESMLQGQTHTAVWGCRIFHG